MNTDILTSTRTRRVRSEISAEFKRLVRKAKIRKYSLDVLLKRSNYISRQEKYSNNLVELTPVAINLPIGILAKYADSVIRTTYRDEDFINTVLLFYGTIADGTLIKLYTTISLGNLAFLFLKAANPIHRTCSLGILQRIKEACNTIPTVDDGGRTGSRRRQRPSSA